MNKQKTTYKYILKYSDFASHTQKIIKHMHIKQMVKELLYAEKA